MKFLLASNSPRRRELLSEIVPAFEVVSSRFEEIAKAEEGGKERCLRFADAVEDRFNNPFVDHALLSISLNSTAKWQARCLPSLLEYTAVNGALPPCLAMGFAAYLAFYTSGIQALTDEGLVCRRPNGDAYTVCDDRWVLEFYHAHRADDLPDLVHAVMTNERMWGRDLTRVPGFEPTTVQNLALIREQGALAAFAGCL